MLTPPYVRHTPRVFSSPRVHSKSALALAGSLLRWHVTGVAAPGEEERALECTLKTVNTSGIIHTAIILGCINCHMGYTEAIL